MNPERNVKAQARKTGPAEDPLAHLLRLVGPREPVPAESRERARLAAHAEWRRVVGRRARQVLFVRLLAASGAAAALVLAVGWWLRPAPGPAAVVAVVQRAEGPVFLRQRSAAEGAGAAPVSGGNISAGTWIETGASGRVALRLNSGASLRLDVASRARLDSATALVLRSGAVYVDSGARDSRSQLEVETPFGVARDVGTQFELRLNARGLRLRVREGRVDMDSAGGVHGAEAGEELRLAEGRALERSAAPLRGPDWGWTQAIAPAFAIEGRSLRAFLEWYGRETRYEIDIRAVPASAYDEAMLIHGSVDGLTPDEALGAVLPTCGLSHRLVGRTLIVEPLDDAPPGRPRPSRR